MELNLVKVINKKEKTETIFVVDDKSYDAMLVCGGCWELEKDYDWKPIGYCQMDNNVIERIYKLQFGGE